MLGCPAAALGAVGQEAGAIALCMFKGRPGGDQSKDSVLLSRGGQTIRRGQRAHQRLSQKISWGE